MSDTPTNHQEDWEKEEGETTGDRRKSARKRKNICYSDTPRRSKKQKEMPVLKDNLGGNVPRGPELMRSPAPRAAPAGAGNVPPVVMDTEDEHEESDNAQEEAAQPAPAPPPPKTQEHSFDS